METQIELLPKEVLKELQIKWRNCQAVSVLPSWMEA